MNQSDDQKLGPILIQQGLLTAQQWDQFNIEKRQAYRQAQATLQGILYQIDEARSVLSIRESLSYSLIAEIPLMPGPATWKNWGDHLLLFDPLNHQLHSQWPLDWYAQPPDTFGLVSSSHFDYVYSPSMSQQTYVPLSKTLYSSRYYSGKEGAGPYDMYLHGSGQPLLIGDRNSGQIWVISTEHYQWQHTLKVRAPGFLKSLHGTVDPKSNRLLLTDGLTGTLKIYHLKTNHWEEHHLGLGLLANIGLTSDPQLFYLYVLQPSPMLHICNLKTFKSLHQIPLPGRPASPYHDFPTELTAMAPDGEHLLLLTYQYSPTQAFVPYSHVVHLPTAQLLQSSALPEQLQPAGLAYIQSNPAHRPQCNLWEWLREKQGLTPDQLLFIQDQAQLPATPPTIELQAHHQTDITPGPRAEEFIFPAEALAEVMDFLKEQFAQQQGINLDDYPLTKPELRSEAHRILDILTTHEQIEVFIPTFFRGLALQTTLSRSQLRQLLTLQKAQPVFTEGVAPTHCPACQQPLLGRWTCNSCGYELDDPQRQHQRRHVSYTPITHLGPGYLLLPDTHRHRLLLLNPFKFIVWELDTAQVGIPSPIWAVWLANRHILLTDATGAIAKLNFSGQMTWRFQSQLSPAHQLNHPVKATAYLHPDGQERILIVDQGNHRVLETNHASEILWQYGHQGQAAAAKGYLDTPSDIQRTTSGSYLIADTGNHRVLEINDGFVLHIFGRQEQLKSPVFAERDLRENTLIVDAGNWRLLEQKTSHVPHLQCSYFRKGMDPEYKIVPQGAIRLSNHNVLLWDADKLQEIAPQQKVRTWHLHWNELQWVPGLQKTEVKPPERPLPDPALLQQRLARLPLLQEAPPTLLAQCVKHLVPFSLAASKTLLAAGQPQDRLYLLCHGHLQLCPESLELAPTELPPDALLGEMCLLVPETRPYSIQARTDCELRVLTAETFQHLLISYPEFATSIALLKDSREQLVEHKQNPAPVLDPTPLERLAWQHQLQRSSHPPTIPPTLHLTTSSQSPLLPLKIWCVDRKRNAICCLNRQGEMIWEYEMESLQRTLKSQSLYETADSILVVDTGHQQILEITLFDQQILHEWKPPDVELLRPRSIYPTPQGLVIADEGHQRLIEITASGEICWEFGHPHAIDQPYHVEYLPHHNILFVDAGLNLVREIDRGGNTIWSYGLQGELNRPEFATRLPNGHTLIADTQNQRVIEVNTHGKIHWEYSGQLSNRLVNPLYCQRLPNGHTLICHHQQHQTQEVDIHGRVVWDLRLKISGMLNLTGLSMGSMVADNLVYTDIEKHVVGQALDEGQQCLELHIKLRKNCKMKATRLSLISLLLEKMGTVIKTYPSADDMLADKTGQKVIFTLLTKYRDEQIFEEVLGVAEVEQVDVYKLTQ